MLVAYQTATKNLLQNPSAPTTLYDTTSLNLWINQARGQLAGDAECIRALGIISTVIGQRPYNFSSIDTGVGATTGIGGTIHIRAITYNVGDGQQWVAPRAWPWFVQYHLNNPVPVNGVPTTWAQLGQGSSGVGAITGIGTGSMSSGNFYLDPPPNLIYTLNVDVVCYPNALTSDTTVEAIPYLFSDAVPFLAAYFALMSAQTGARYGDAERLYTHYETFRDRARKFSTPAVSRYLYEQSGDPTAINRLGMQPKAAGTG